MGCTQSHTADLRQSREQTLVLPIPIPLLLATQHPRLILHKCLYRMVSEITLQQAFAVGLPIRHHNTTLCPTSLISILPSTVV